MKSLGFFFAVILGLTSGVGAQPILIAAAANLSNLEVPLRTAFLKNHPGAEPQFVFGSSGALVTQMLNGAPYQILLSADTEFAQKLVDAGVAAAPVRVYALGKLIFLATKPLDLSRGLAAVLDPAVAQVAVANPETAPYGRAALQALVRSGLIKGAQGKLVFGQSVTQALQFTLSTTGFGLVSQSSLFSPALAAYSQEGRFWFEVDPQFYDPIEQGFVVVKSAQALPEVRAFAAFLLSPEGRAVFSSFGYGSPKP